MTVELRDQSVICILTFLKIFSICVMVCKHCCLTYSLLVNVLSELVILCNGCLFQFSTRYYFIKMQFSYVISCHHHSIRTELPSLLKWQKKWQTDRQTHLFLIVKLFLLNICSLLQFIPRWLHILFPQKGSPGSLNTKNIWYQSLQELI